jgi:hypothetical protein
MASDAPLLRVFTHPACGGCGAAVRLAFELRERHPGVALRTVRLETPEGLAEAHAERITTIPTIIVSGGGAERARLVGAPARDVLAAALEEVAP